MRILYIFPHPDDESFGPSVAMHAQLQAGHEVFLYTLTRGGATKQRHRLGYSVEEMGAVRYAEMKDVQEVLGLTGMKVDDFPDSGLKEMDPRVLEDAIRAHILEIRPEIVVSYPVHGISGFHDHLVAHAVVKRVFVEMKEEHTFLRRLAFYTLTESGAEKASGKFRISGSTEEEIDVLQYTTEADRDAMMAGLKCYKTYQEVIAQSIGKSGAPHRYAFELFGEQFDPPLGAIDEQLPNG